MLSTWLENLIHSNRKRECHFMNFDLILEKMGRGKQINLLPTAPTSVSIQPKDTFYIKPNLTDMFTQKDSKLFLFSAPGATGKSALAREICRSRNALLWDLSKERIANHSFSGMLVDSMGSGEFSNYTTGLETGESVLVIDALDEAEMISGKLALETLLTDVRATVINAKTPNIALCARTETALFIRHFFSSPEHALPISQYEIGFFPESSAVEFVLKKIQTMKPATKATEKYIQEQFAEIKKILGNNDSIISSFLGYAPVLEAIAVFTSDEANTMSLLQKIGTTANSTEVFCKIIEHIIIREAGKVQNGFREKCQRDYPEFNAWTDVYTGEEQMVRLISLLTCDSIAYSDYPIECLPRELSVEYMEAYSGFIKEHPFIKYTEKNGSVICDFAGPAFRDYVLAKLMTMQNYDMFAQEYISMFQGCARFASQLFFDFYALFSQGKMKKSHFLHLYDAFKSKETAKISSAVLLEETDEGIYCRFTQTGQKSKEQTEFYLDADSEPIAVNQLNNVYMDVNCDVVLGGNNEDAAITNSTVKCRQLILASQAVMITAQEEGGTVLIAREGINATKCPTAKIELRVEDDSLLKVDIPDINSWFKLRKYKYTFENESDIDITRFENAMKSILKYFRKHGKDAPGRHYEYINNVVVGNSKLKQSVLSFLNARGVIYQDHKDIKQYKLNDSRLDAMGINWGMLAQNSSQGMESVFEAYQKWMTEG